MPSHSTPHLPKHKNIRKAPHSASTIISNSAPVTSLKAHFLTLIRQFAYPQQPNTTNPMISFLNIRPTVAQVSMQYIPSIENMISQQQIGQDDPGLSRSSIQRGFSGDIISQTNNDMRVMYICLLRRIMHQLQHSTSISQRRKIIRGGWNILTKYCKDHKFTLFGNVGTHIEWGLLELINFDFTFTNRQKFIATQMLHKHNTNNSKDNQKEQKGFSKKQEYNNMSSEQSIVLV